MTLSPGQMLQNRYRIVSLLGKGGMGAVYRAWDTRLEVPVALKEMTAQPGLDSETLSQLGLQFQQEAQILARLQHSHLVRVGDFFNEAGNAYLVMDYVEGESLAELIKQKGKLPEPEVLEWTSQLLDALAYCHGRGVIHRDIKPQNVIIRSDKQAVLVDFGLVKLWDPDDPHTKTVMRGMGTPEYAPPEQYDASAGHTDARSDIYSVGATLYHALSGQIPPTATMRIVNPVRLQPIRALAPGVRLQTELVITKAMELQPDERYQSVQEMAAALREETVALISPAMTAHERTKVMTSAQPAQAAKQPAKVMPDGQTRRAVPRWVWTAGGVVVAGLILGGAIWAMRGAKTPAISVPMASPTPTITPTHTPLPPPTSTPRPTATPTPPATSTSTSTPPPTATDTPQATSTPASTDTPTPLPTSTPTTTPSSSTNTPKPASQATPPVPTGPSLGGEFRSPITFEWEGTLGADQAYQVIAYHLESGHTLQSGPLIDTTWTVDLPGDKYGEWRWTVSVMQGQNAVATSSEWMFWFQPFGGPSGGEEPLPPTRVSEG